MVEFVLPMSRIRFTASGKAETRISHTERSSRDNTWMVKGSVVSTERESDGGISDTLG